MFFPLRSKVTIARWTLCVCMQVFNLYECSVCLFLSVLLELFVCMVRKIIVKMIKKHVIINENRGGSFVHLA